MIVNNVWLNKPSFTIINEKKKLNFIHKYIHQVNADQRITCGQWNIEFKNIVDDIKRKFLFINPVNLYVDDDDNLSKLTFTKVGIYKDKNSLRYHYLKYWYAIIIWNSIDQASSR